jgi:serine/threonine protein kinase
MLDLNTNPEPHTLYDTPTSIPYTHQKYLGRGTHGTVDRVKCQMNGSVYARKMIHMPRVASQHLSARYRGEAFKRIQEIKEEARIIRRLNHKHVVRVIFTYESPNEEDRPVFCLILLPVARQDLSDVLLEVDHMEPGPAKNSAICKMQHWAGCLVRAMDYIHVMNVKHKDIKPANVLVENDNVYITDFGIAKEIEVGATSGSSDVAGTLTYRSPETDLNPDGTVIIKRGRSSDVYSMGCCFLEMATVMITDGELDRLRELRRGPYARNPDMVLRWIFYLTSLLVARKRAIKTEPGEDAVLKHASILPGLVFVMLDPNPKARATGRQLVALICAFARSLFCDACAKGATNDPNIPLHSVFKQGKEMSYPADPEDALKQSVAEDWEAAKRKWLKHHVWW